MRFNVYGIIILLSVAAGCISAAFLCRRGGVSKRTVFYTAFLNIFCIMAFSVYLAVIQSGFKSLGFAGLGAAFGLMAGLVISLFIHKDHPGAMFASWTVSAALMFSVSKLACLSSGCCGGSVFGFPVQAAESAAFFVVYAVSVFVFFAKDDKMISAYTAMILAFIARFGLDFFRTSHAGKVISLNQILVLVAGSVAAAALTAVNVRGKRKVKAAACKGINGIDDKDRQGG